MCAANPSHKPVAATSSLRLDPQRRWVEGVDVVDWEASSVGELFGGVIGAGYWGIKFVAQPHPGGQRGDAA